MILRRNQAFLLALAGLFLLSLQSTAALADGPPALTDGTLDQVVEVGDGGVVSAVELFRALGSATGVDVAFAPKYRDFKVDWSPTPVTLREALDALSVRSASFWVPTGNAAILIANDTPQMRRMFTPVVVASFPLRHVSIGDMMTTLRSIYGVKHLTADETRNLLTVRDTADTVALARDLVERHDIRPPTTLVKLELVALDSNDASGGETLLAADASIVGQGEAGVRVERSPLDESTWLDLGVSLEARTEGREIVLDLSVESAVLRKSSENSHAATHGTWRSGNGAPFLVQLPLTLDAVGDAGDPPRTLALRVTPTVADGGEPAKAESIWVGTEVSRRAPDTAP